MQILWVNPPSVPYGMVIRRLAGETVDLDQTVAMPMGILYLAAVLEHAAPDIQMEILDLAKCYREWYDAGERPTTLEHFLTEAFAACRAPDWIGISVLFSTAHRTTLEIAKVAKRLWPDAPIVVGGMHATNAVAQLLGDPAIDAVCRGEAEEIIPMAVRGQAVPGVVRRGDRLSTCPLPKDLDALPFPAWHRLPMAEYLESNAYRGRRLDRIEQDRIATIVTTRGCPFQCTFCASWTVHGREMRYRSIPNVLRELEILYERYGVREVVPEDDLFTVKKPRILALCDAVGQRFQGTLSFQFPNGLSVATLDEDVIRAMKQLGMKVANIAIESGSRYVQKHIIKKNVDLDQARRVIDACRREGIIARAYFILGFPGETRAHMEETIRFAESLPLDWAVIHPAAPLIGTEMFDQLVQRGEIDQTFNWDDAFFQERAYDSPEVTATEVKALCGEANLRINFRNNWNLRNGFPERARDLFQDIVLQYPNHVEARTSLAVAEAACA